MTQKHLQADTTEIENALTLWVANGSGLGEAKTIWFGQQGPRPQAPYISMLLSEELAPGSDWLDTEDNIFSFAPFTFVADATTNQLTKVAHGLITGDGPVRLTTTTTLPAPLALATDYYTIRVDADNVKLATSLANALAGSFVDLTNTGAGTHTLSDTATTVHAGAEVLNTVRGPRKLTFSLQCFAVDATGVSAARAALGRVLTSCTLPTISAALVAAGIGVADWTKIMSTGGTLNTVVFEPRATVTIKLHTASEMSETGTYVGAVTTGPTILP